MQDYVTCVRTKACRYSWPGRPVPVNPAEFGDDRARQDFILPASHARSIPAGSREQGTALHCSLISPDVNAGRRYYKNDLKHGCLTGIPAAIKQFICYGSLSPYALQTGSISMISILYVDDEPGLLEIARIFLEASGEFTVTTTTSAEKSLELLSTRLYDAIISDYQMPDIDGIALLKIVREKYDDTPFILFTGRGREEVVIEAINNGADFYIQKGGDPESQFAELAHKIRQAVRRRETERELRRSESRLRSFVETTRESVTIVDEEGKVIEWNAGAERITGIRKEEALGSYLWDLTFRMLPREHHTEERRALLEQRIRTSLRTGIPVFEEPQVIEAENPDGSRIYTRQTIFPIRTDKGFGIGSIAQDITSEKLAENALRESEKKYHDLAELLPQVVFEADTDGNLTYTNHIAFQYFGYTEDDFRRGLNVMQMLVPGDVERAAAAFRALVEGKEMVAGASNEYTALRKDQSMFPISVYPTLILVNGRITGLRGIIVDITERRKAEEALRESEERFRGMTERSSDCILVLNKEMSPTYVSPSAWSILGFAPEELVGKPPEFAMATIFSGTGPALMDAVKATMSGLPVENVELQLCRKDKTPVIVSLFAVPVLRDGILEGVQVSMRDITERTATQSALQAVIGSMVGTTGLNSLQKIVENVSSWLGVDCVMVGEIQPDHDTVKVLSMILDGKQVNDFIYHLKGTPCENVAEKGFCHYPDDSARLFPGAKDIIELNIQGYVGTPLWNSQGKVSGILCALSRKPLQLSPSVKEILDTIAVKAAAEVERIRMGRELEESQRMVAKAMDLANLVNWELDLRTGLFKFNDRFYALYGTSAEREGGYLMTPEKYNREFVHPEDRDLVAAAFGGPPPSSDTGSEFQMEHRIIRRDGEIRTIIVRVGVSQDSGGQDISVHGANQDITDRKRAEAELQQSQYLLAEATEMAHMADWEFDASTGVFTFNDRFYALYGTTAGREGGYQMPAEVYAREFTHPDDQSMVGEEIAKALSAPDSGYFSLREHRIIRRDGEVRWITVRIRVTKDAEGRTIKTHGANQDITDRKNMEEAIRQANKKLSLLSGITRHDINNQLLALNGFVSLLQHDITDTAYKKYFSRITEASKNIAEMIRFTKEYEKIGTGAPVWQDLTTVIAAAGKGIIPGQFTLKNDLPATTELFADPMLEKVFFNLLDNAVRHGERVTEIHVSSRPAGGNLVIVWEDNGVGIAADEKERIFERGFGKNTGLGMFLVREILSLTGIPIVETGEPGRGARFEMTVPHGSWRITR